MMTNPTLNHTELVSPNKPIRNSKLNIVDMTSKPNNINRKTFFIAYLSET